MDEKEKWRPRPFFGSFRWLDDLLEDIRWEEATEEALKKYQAKNYIADPKKYDKEDKKDKTG